VIINIDLILQSVFHSGVVSHRNEFADASVETSFFSVLKDIFSRGDFHHDAYTRHMFILFPVLAAIVLLVTCKAVRKHTFAFCLCAGTLVVFAAAEAFFSSSVSAGLMNILPGMFKSFQFDRTYYFLPGLWYILLGLSFAIVLELFKEKWAVLGIIAVGIFSMVILKDVAKDEEGIFYQNINQVNNGESVTGYITMKNLYSEPLMAEIEETIGRDMKDYRVAHIGISPVAALLHGFYTIDGYSNNYSLAYKHEFRKIIEKELELNDFNRAYFDDWGSRCYIFYHEWGNAYLLKKGFSGTITDLRLDFAKMKELNCDFIFSAGEIIDAEQYGLLYRGYYSTDDSYWGIYLYELN
ncbi:MAG: hypothetical protein IKZ39_06905, partial [Lachnospiraceae bacterium]|nr:hypothetical protein [Lachnospiraceae bacterium]